MGFDVVTYAACKAYVDRFISSAAPTNWEEFRNAVRAGTISNYFSVGDQFNVLKGATNLVFDIVDIGSSTRNVTANGNAPTDPNYFTQFPNAKPVTLLMHDTINNIQYNAAEANYVITTQIASGSKCVILLQSTNYRFTAPQNLVVNGLLRFNTAVQMQYYATPTSSVVNIVIAEGEADAEFISVSGSLSTQNDLAVAANSTNSYLASAARQWCIAAGAAGTFWIPKTAYAIQPSWNATLAGFLNGLSADFQAAVGETTREVELNTSLLGGGNGVIQDKYFLPSEMEIMGTAENVTHKGVQFQLYSGTADADRIKFDSAALSTARSWYLRSPVASHKYAIRCVTAVGALHSGTNPTYSFANAVCCVIL